MPTLDSARIHKELEELLCRLIRFDTTNPPGQETELCRFVAETLDREGIPSVIFESAPGRGNIVARIKGDGSKRPLLLLSHSDVVPATASDWSVPPFEGVVKDGFVWGRGAIDCKGVLATELMVVLEMKRRGIIPKRDIILCCAADEECNGVYGASWLSDNHYDKIDAEFCINEGGGQAIPFGGKNVYLLQNAEKGTIALKLTTRGAPGHGSVPKKDNCIAAMTAALNTIARSPAPIRRTPVFEEMLRRLSPLLPFPQGAFIMQLFNPALSELILSQVDAEEMRDVFRAMLRDTISLTKVNAGYKENVIPEKCEAVIDCRILPGSTREGLIARLKRMTKLNEIEEVFNEKVPHATESTIDCELFRVIESVIGEHDPTGILSPIMMPGATDSRFLRQRGMIAYGFHPMRSAVDPRVYLPTPHGIDERIPCDALHFGFDVMWDIVARLI